MSEELRLPKESVVVLGQPRAELKVGELAVSRAGLGAPRGIPLFVLFKGMRYEVVAAGGRWRRLPMDGELLLFVYLHEHAGLEKALGKN